MDMYLSETPVLNPNKDRIAFFALDAPTGGVPSYFLNIMDLNTRKVQRVKQTKGITPYRLRLSFR